MLTPIYFKSFDIDSRKVLLTLTAKKRLEGCKNIQFTETTPHPPKKQPQITLHSENSKGKSNEKTNKFDWNLNLDSQKEQA